MKKIFLGAFIALMACVQPMDAQERRGGPGRMNPEQMVESRVKMLDKELDLTDEQEANIKAIYQKFYGQQPKNRGSRDEMRKKMDELNEKIKGQLTDQQKEKFDKMNKEMRRRGPGGDFRPGGGRR